MPVTLVLYCLIQNLIQKVNKKLKDIFSFDSNNYQQTYCQLFAYKYKFQANSLIERFVLKITLQIDYPIINFVGPKQKKEWLPILF